MLPAATTVPAAGFCEITSPWGTVRLDADSSVGRRPTNMRLLAAAVEGWETGEGWNGDLGRDPRWTGAYCRLGRGGGPRGGAGVVLSARRESKISRGVMPVPVSPISI